jgi:transcriptional regulator GlxA family with amidase domain
VDIGTQNVGILVLPGFSLTALGCATEPLTIANRVYQAALYRWSLLSTDGRPVPADIGLSITPQMAVDPATNYSMALLVGGSHRPVDADPTLIAWLRKLVSAGCRLGSIGYATRLLADAGLLTGYRCAVPQRLCAEFTADFPAVELVPESFSIDRDRFSCPGGLAVADMMLVIMGERLGIAGLDVIATEMLCRWPRTPKRVKTFERQFQTDRRITKAISLMRNNMGPPLRIGVISTRVGLSERELERLFRKQFCCTPSSLYMELRLQRVHELLTNSADPISKIAAECGFSDSSHLTKRYREAFQQTPTQVRHNAA